MLRTFVIEPLYAFGLFLRNLFILACVAGVIMSAIGAGAILLWEHVNPRSYTAPANVTQVLRVVDESKSMPSDVRILAATMWGEARGDGIESMRAVGHVIVNRQSAATGESLSQVIFKYRQFSAWNEDDPNSDLLKSLNERPPRGRDLEMWLAAQTLAADILDGRSTDPTHGALFYATTGLNPYWADNNAITVLIGAHTFYASSL